MSTPKFKSGRNAKMLSMSERENEVLVPAAAEGMFPVTCETVPEGNCPVVRRPMVFKAPVDNKLTPN
jgi:hypothetical protein